MPTTLIFPQATYPVGSLTILPQPIPTGLQQVRFSVDVSLHMNPLTQWSILLDLSLDGGVTWIAGYIGASRTGAPLSIDRNGVVSPAAWFARSLPEPNNPNRMIRGQSVISGGAITLAGSLVLT